MNVETEVHAIMAAAGWSPSVSRQGDPLPFARVDGGFWIVNGRPNGVDDHVGVAGHGAEFQDPIALAYALVDRAKVVQRVTIPWASPDVRAALDGMVPHEIEEPESDPRDEALAAAEAELAALRRRIAELEQAPLLPAPDALLSDWGEVGETYDDITGDMLLDAFELGEAETAAVVQTLSALRLKHLSEQLNVERARLDREHQATGIANPRSASIDRLLGLLTRRGEV